MYPSIYPSHICIHISIHISIYSSIHLTHSSHPFISPIRPFTNILATQGKPKLCQKQCEKLLAVNPDNKSASLMLADILSQTSSVDAATYHFKQLLVKKPDNFAVMSRMITMLWRAGNLDEAKMFLQVRTRSEQCL